MSDYPEKLPDSIVLSDSIADLPLSLRDKVELFDEFDILCSQRFTELAQLIEEHADIEVDYGESPDQKPGRSFRAFASNFTFAMNLEKIVEEQSGEWDHSGISDPLCSPNKRREIYKSDVVPPNREKPNSRFSKLIPSYVNEKTLGDEYEMESPNIQSLINVRKANSERTKKSEEKQLEPRISIQQLLLENEKNLDSNIKSTTPKPNSMTLNPFPELKIKSSESLVINDQHECLSKPEYHADSVKPNAFSEHELELHSPCFTSNDLLSKSVSDFKKTGGQITPKLFSNEKLEQENVIQDSKANKVSIETNYKVMMGPAQADQPHNPSFMHSLFKFRPKPCSRIDRLKGTGNNFKPDFSKKKTPCNEELQLNDSSSNKMLECYFIKNRPTSLNRSPNASKQPVKRIKPKLTIPKSLSPPKPLKQHNLKFNGLHIQM